MLTRMRFGALYLGIVLAGCGDGDASGKQGNEKTQSQDSPTHACGAYTDAFFDEPIELDATWSTGLGDDCDAVDLAYGDTECTVAQAGADGLTLDCLGGFYSFAFSTDAEDIGAYGCGARSDDLTLEIVPFFDEGEKIWQLTAAGNPTCTYWLRHYF